jgi:hypothetical protein
MDVMVERMGVNDVARGTSWPAVAAAAWLNRGSARTVLTSAYRVTSQASPP